MGEGQSLLPKAVIPWVPPKKSMMASSAPSVSKAETSYLPEKHRGFDCRGVRDGTVRDRFWMWSSIAGAHNGGLNPVPGDSKFTALDGAKSMGFPPQIANDGPSALI